MNAPEWPGELVDQYMFHGAQIQVDLVARRSLALAVREILDRHYKEWHPHRIRQAELVYDHVDSAFNSLRAGNFLLSDRAGTPLPDIEGHPRLDRLHT